MADKETRTTVDGLRAVEMYYRPIKEIASGSTAFYQSQTRLNAPDIGVLMPETFRDVCEMSSQAIKLFQLELVQLLNACTAFTERELNYGWASVYMPVRFLKEKRAPKIVTDVCLKREVPTSKVCFELSEDLLAETEGQIAANIVAMRNLGFHFMLTGFGGNNCPMMRLSNFAVDYVMFSPEVANYIGKDERSDNAVKSIISFVNDIGSEPVTDGVSNSHQAETVYGFECSYCAGSLSGKYIAEKDIKGKNEE